MPEASDRGDGARIPRLVTNIAQPAVTKPSKLYNLYFDPGIDSRRPRISGDDFRPGSLPSEIGEIADAGFGAKGDDQRGQ